ncbi:MAG: hypothetical protein AAF483_06140 [Planctomycetota bacterium]
MIDFIVEYILTARMAFGYIATLMTAYLVSDPTGSIVLGGEPSCPADFSNIDLNLGFYEFDTCHWHWQLEGYVGYFLDRLDPSTGKVLETVLGRKAGYCLGDNNY